MSKEFWQGYMWCLMNEFGAYAKVADVIEARKK